MCHPVQPGCTDWCSIAKWSHFTPKDASTSPCSTTRGTGKSGASPEWWSECEVEETKRRRMWYICTGWPIRLFSKQKLCLSVKKHSLCFMSANPKEQPDGSPCKGMSAIKWDRMGLRSNCVHIFTHLITTWPHFVLCAMKWITLWIIHICCTKRSLYNSVKKFYWLTPLTRKRHSIVMKVLIRHMNL